MTKQNTIKLFEEKKVRTVWDDETEEWYFSVVDIVGVLTNNERPRKYWNDLKVKLKKEGSELSEKIGQLRMPASDGKYYKTEVNEPETFDDHVEIAKEGGNIARNARLELEQKTGQKVVTPLNAKNLLQLKEKDTN